MPSLDLILTLTVGLAVALLFGFLTVRIRLPSIVGYLLAGLLIGRSVRRGGEPRAQSSRSLSLLLPADAPLALTGPGPLGMWQLAVAVAPTGDKLAYVASRAGTTMLAVRPLDRDSAVVLPEIGRAHV